MSFNGGLSEINLPSLTSVGEWFLHDNKGLSEINLPSLTSAGDCFLGNNTELREKILAEIDERKKAKVPTSKDIATMDGLLKITTSEIRTIGMMLKRLFGKDNSQQH